MIILTIPLFSSATYFSSLGVYWGWRVNNRQNIVCWLGDVVSTGACVVACRGTWSVAWIVLCHLQQVGEFARPRSNTADPTRCGWWPGRWGVVRVNGGVAANVELGSLFRGVHSTSRSAGVCVGRHWTGVAIAWATSQPWRLHVKTTETVVHHQKHPYNCGNYTIETAEQQASVAC